MNGASRTGGSEAAAGADVISSLPEWFTRGEVIPLEDYLGLVVGNERMRRVVAACRAVAEAPAPVLFTGETGVGKSLLSRFMHASRDPYAPFVSFVTAGLDSRVLAERLFTPAPGQPAPLVREAAGGTLVLEESAGLPPDILRGLARMWRAQDRRKAPGGPALLVFTTNTPPAAKPGQGALSPEFLKLCRHIHVPPLRTRKQDIPAMVAYFTRLKCAREFPLERVEKLAKRLLRHDFPGNVRELETLVSLEAAGLPWTWRKPGSGGGILTFP